MRTNYVGGILSQFRTYEFWLRYTTVWLVRTLRGNRVHLYKGFVLTKKTPPRHAHSDFHLYKGSYARKKICPRLHT